VKEALNAVTGKYKVVSLPKEGKIQKCLMMNISRIELRKRTHRVAKDTCINPQLYETFNLFANEPQLREFPIFLSKNIFPPKTKNFSKVKKLASGRIRLQKLASGRTMVHHCVRSHTLLFNYHSKKLINFGISVFLIRRLHISDFGKVDSQKIHGLLFPETRNFFIKPHSQRLFKNPITVADCKSWKIWNNCELSKAARKFINLLNKRKIKIENKFNIKCVFNKSAKIKFEAFINSLSTSPKNSQNGMAHDSHLSLIVFIKCPHAIKRSHTVEPFRHFEPFYHRVVHSSLKIVKKMSQENMDFARSQNRELGNSKFDYG
jgi:hypothetical protein